MVDSTPDRYRSRSDLLSDRQTRLILLVTFAGLIGTILPAILPGIAAALDVKSEQVGWIITFYKLPSIVVILLTAALADIYGRKTVLLPSLFLFGFAGTAMYFVETFPLLLLFALVMGIGAATVLPLTVTLLGDHHTGRTNTNAQGLRVGVVGLAIITLPAVAGYLSGIAWNLPFLMFSLTIPILVIAYFLLKETEKYDGESGTTPAEVKSSLKSYRTVIVTQFTDRYLGVLVLGGFARGFVKYGFLTFVPLFAVQELGATLFAAGLLLSIRGVSYIVISPMTSEFVWAIGRKRVMSTAFFCSAIALYLIPYSQSLYPLAVLMVLYAIGDAMFDPVIKDSVTSLAQPDYRAGAVNGLYVLKRIGQTSAPVFFGIILALLDFVWVFSIAATIAVGYVLLLEVLFRNRSVVLDTTGRSF